MSRRKKQKKIARENLDSQKKRAHIRAKYGPRMKPAPVTIRSMIDFEVVEIVKQSDLVGWRRP
jgi:hypothetical protein